MSTYIFSGYDSPTRASRDADSPRRSRRRGRKRDRGYAAIPDGGYAATPDRGYAAMTEDSGRSERHDHRGRRGGHNHGRGGPDFGAEGEPGFGRGPGFGPRRGRRRASRGDVRAAVLALLAEEPQHGYAVNGQLAERSGGLWRPSPGSIYPVLAQLEQEGLVTSDATEGRKVFRLTDAGVAYVAEHGDELREPWTPAQTRHRDRAVVLFEAVHALGSAAKEVARNGSDAQVDQARSVLDEARRSLYRILAADPTEPTEPTDPTEDQQ
jgi:DNA-binding PadR family transcriptional regulator